MKSKFADLSNLGNISYGGTITAGIFLQEFIKDIGNPK
jgi:leucyl aminopeptidase